MIKEIIQIFLLFILPVILVYAKVIPFRYRRHTMGIVAAVTTVLIVYERFDLNGLGIRLDNIVSAAIPYLIFTMIGIMMIFLIARITGRKRLKGFYEDKRFIAFIIVGSIIQELMYRGFLFPKLQQITGNFIVLIIINAILFTIMHLIYSNSWISIATIFAAGLGFAWMYGVYPNLILIAISHIILNQVAVSYNFYREENIRKAGA